MLLKQSWPHDGREPRPVLVGLVVELVVLDVVVDASEAFDVFDIVKVG